MLLGASSGAGEPAGACDVSSALCNVRPGQRRQFFFASFQGGASGAWVIGARNHRPGVRTRVSEAAECLSGENHFREPLTTHHSPLSSPLSCIWTGRGGGCTLRPRNPSAVETLWSRPSIDHTASQIELCTASALGSAELRWTHTQRQHPHRHKHTHILHSCRGAPHVVLPCTLHIDSCFLLGASSRCVTHISCQHRHYVNMCR